MQKLTARQTEILTYIQGYMQETGMPPTRLEISKDMGFRSPNAAEEHLRALARKGAIEMIPSTSRGIRLPINKQLGLPVVGQVAAGSPILAEECIAARYDIPPSLFTPRADYLLTVKGDSMVDVGIYEDDLLAVHKTDVANDGDIVVARVEDEVTVKRLQKNRGGRILKLIAENPDYAAIEVDLKTQRFAIEGVSVGVIRRQVS
ncbi:MAG: transcriptional repressor LexA [Pseudohongiellaceae bacterium]